MATTGSAEPPRVAILSSPGTGHLTPLLEFAKLLHLHHNLAVTLITYSDFSSPSQESLLSSLPSGVSSLSLPSVSLSDLPPDSRVETLISVLVARSVPSLKTLLLSLNSSSNLLAYVIDLFGGDTLSAAKDLGLPHYMFFTSNFFMLSFMFHLPTLHDTTSCEFRDLPEPLRLPGCVPLNGADFLDPIQDRSNEAYGWVVHLARRFREVEGILVNSFEALEPGACRIHTSNKRGRTTPPTYAVGPVIHSASAGGGEGSECLEWLDRQPRGSVLFVSFGSGGTLSCEQMTELALGLEASGQRFLWVVRTPSDSESNGSFLGFRDGNDPLSYLPEGFLGRGLGMVVTNWAPQIEALGHAAVGGFMSHCGWNSTLESVMSGVPMIAWPLYAEQHMNAAVLSEGVKVAIRPRASEKGLVGREEICRVVKELMGEETGKAMREKMGELREAGMKAWDEDGGPSYGAIAEVVDEWKRAIAL